MDSLSGGQNFDAVRKKEGLQSVGETCKLPRNLHSNVQVCMSAKLNVGMWGCLSWIAELSKQSIFLKYSNFDLRRP